MPASIHHYDRKGLSKFPDLMSPIVRVGQSAMQQQNGRTSPKLRKKNACAVDR